MDALQAALLSHKIACLVPEHPLTKTKVHNLSAELDWGFGLQVDVIHACLLS